MELKILACWFGIVVGYCMILTGILADMIYPTEAVDGTFTLLIGADIVIIGHIVDFYIKLHERIEGLEQRVKGHEIKRDE